ncbi:hypothetical protein CLIB1444_10S04236 [[Candida] jaroonii]|uniref:Uncharacterized protein n=1 Tax=[Candida] jaroonii TaxID=467808 RepID=A0ACA9YCW1_9ASCO|nr:hypothetical protein CLIB1444_10S04236 [[Candida] jaroonii]
MSTIPKKRNRKILVCYNCRSKKNKCDRQLPCSSCKRLGIDDSCKYSDEKPKSSTINFPLPPTTNNDQVPAIKRYEAVAITRSYPYLPTYSKDPAVNLLWKYWLFQFRDIQYNQFVLATSSLGVPAAKLNFETKYFPEITDPIEYSTFTSGSVSIRSIIGKVNQYGKTVGLVYDQDFPHNSSIIERIKYILPNELQLVNLHKIFFEKIAEFVPVIDEFEHYEQLKNLFDIITPSTRKITKINIKFKQHYTILAQILIINRIAYVFMVLNNISTDVVVPVDSVRLAEHCIETHGLLNQPTLSCLQSLTLLQFYRLVAPEKFQGYVSEPVLRGNIMEMAITLGFHRDSTKLILESIDPKINNLRRKIWFHIYQSNILQQSLFPTSPSPVSREFDISWPHFDYTINNYRNPLVEKHIIDGFLFSAPIVDNLVKFLESTQKLQPDFTNLDEMADTFGTGTDNFLGSFDELMEITPGFFKITGFRNFIYAKLFLTVTYFINFLNKEELGDQDKAKACFTTVLHLIFDVLGKFSPKLLKDPKTRFGEMFYLVILPLLTLVYNLLLIICIGLILRIKCTILLTKDPSTIDKLNDWIDILKKFCLIRIKYLIEMSVYSQFAIKILKIHLFHILMIFDDNGIYKLLNNEVKPLFLNLNYDEVVDMMAICKNVVENEIIDDVNCFTVNDILKLDLNCNLKLASYMRSDKLWNSVSILRLYNEIKVPKDNDGNDDDDEFVFNNPLFVSIPTFRGYFGLHLE